MELRSVLIVEQNMKIMNLFAHYAELQMNNDEINWDNFSKARLIIDCWTDGNYSYALILYPNNVLHLQWLNLNK
jgi:hypothetical protein